MRFYYDRLVSVYSFIVINKRVGIYCNNYCLSGVLTIVACLWPIELGVVLE